MLRLGEPCLATMQAKIVIDIRPSWYKGYLRLGCSQRFASAVDDAVESFTHAIALAAGDDSAISDLQARIDEAKAVKTDPAGRKLLPAQSKSSASASACAGSSGTSSSRCSSKCSPGGAAEGSSDAAAAAAAATAAAAPALCCFGDACVKPATLACGGCGIEAYCSPECQRGVWAAHKVVCRAMVAETAAGTRYSHDVSAVLLTDPATESCRVGDAVESERMHAAEATKLLEDGSTHLDAAIACAAKSDPERRPLPVGVAFGFLANNMRRLISSAYYEQVVLVLETKTNGVSGKVLEILKEVSVRPCRSRGCAFDLT